MTFVGYAIFSHEPLLLERVELIGADKVLITYSVEAEERRGRVAAQVFQRVHRP